MNNEVMKTLTQREYISTFINKDLRLDRRTLTQKRPMTYKFGILDTFSTSASCTLGDGNKIIAVIKGVNKDLVLNPNENSMTVVVEKLADNSPIAKPGHAETNLTNFINKLIDNNLEYDIPSPFQFCLHITIINNDGNIYDCIASLISNLFSGVLAKENECALNRYVKLKRPFKTNTFCVINDKLIVDPSLSELNISSYYFTIIRFDEDEYIIHKINGDSISMDLLEEALNFS